MAANNFNQQEVLELVRDLIRATEEGTAQWRSLEESEEAFVLNTPGGMVTVQSLGEQDHPFLLRLYDANERKLYEMQTEVASFYHSSEGLVGELFHSARNSVFDVGGTIRSIRNSLGLP